MQKRQLDMLGAVLLAAAALVAGIAVGSYFLNRDDPLGEALTPPAQAASISGPLEAHVFEDIARRQMPTVVSLRVQRRAAVRQTSRLFEWLHPFGRPRDPGGAIVVGSGSGFVIGDAGYILTNNHVIEGSGRIYASFYGTANDAYEARIVGSDPLTDTALIRLVELPPGDLPIARLGNSDAMAPGAWVVAIGNPFNLTHTVSVGVISALERPFPIAEGRWQDVLQTDAAINPGNSGGPLLNLRGEVIGINTAIYGSATGGNVGIGFAIPINPVRALLPQLREGKVIRGRLGVGLSRLTESTASALGLDDPAGALVASVEPDGPAARAGIRPGDVMLEFGNQRIEDSDELAALVSAAKPESRVPVRLLRDGERLTVTVVVGELGSEVAAAKPMDSREGFGVSLADVPPTLASQSGSSTGALITSVQPLSPAAQAGLRPGDVIVEINREPVHSGEDARRRLGAIDTGSVALLVVRRDDQEVFVAVEKR